MNKRYRMLKACPHEGVDVPAGSIVYHCLKPDYGCASDDNSYTGKEHWSMTLKEDGDYPFFTVAVEDLELVK